MPPLKDRGADLRDLIGLTCETLCRSPCSIRARPCATLSVSLLHLKRFPVRVHREFACKLPGLLGYPGAETLEGGQKLRSSL